MCLPKENYAQIVDLHALNVINFPNNFHFETFHNPMGITMKFEIWSVNSTQPVKFKGDKGIAVLPFFVVVFYS
jgi:hypothetical protein